MYTEHFGLEKPVFDGGIAQHDDLFLGPRQQRVAANLKIGLTTRDSIVTLTGTLGVGKTTIASRALRMTATRLAQTWVGSTPLERDELLELLLAGFEFTPYDMGRVQRLHTWRQFMSELSVTDTRICILVENALVLGPEGLQALEALTAADPNGCPGANLVLMGPASLHELLEAPGLAPLKQRIRSRQRLEPLTPQEVEQYLRHLTTFAGGDYDTMFAPTAAAMVHCFSAGVPRVINNICETALIVAATRKATQVSPEIVQRVAESVYGLAPTAQLPEAAVAAAPVPVTSAVAAVEPPAAEPVPPADPTPGDAAQVPVHGGEAPIENALAPVNDGQAPSAHADPEPPELPAVSGTADSVAPAPEPPVLTDAVVIDLPDDGEEAAVEAQQSAATMQPEAPTQSDEEPQTEEQFSEDIAAATHLHEISDEMAELLFSEDQTATPLDSGDIELSAEETAEVLQLDDDSMSESEEDQAEPEAVPPAAHTLVF